MRPEPLPLVIRRDRQLLKSQYHQLCWWFEITPPGSSVVPPKGGLTNLVHYITGSRLKAALLTSPERALLCTFYRFRIDITDCFAGGAIFP